MYICIVRVRVVHSQRALQVAHTTRPPLGARAPSGALLVLVGLGRREGAAFLGLLHPSNAMANQLLRQVGRHEQRKPHYKTASAADARGP